MARGWESKAVEDQIEALRDRSNPEGPKSSARRREIERQRLGLLRQRKRVLRDLERCTNDRYRQILGKGLDHLEEQLRRLGWAPDAPHVDSPSRG